MISAIQGLRGLSILLVFLSHWYAGAKSVGLLPSSWAEPLAWMNLGKYGVELFFMISGFVIVKSLVRHRDTLSFGIDRIARIYPVFLAVHLLIFITGPLIHDKFFSGVDTLEWLWLFFVNVLMLPGVLDLPIAQTVAWSLSYEILFYILAAAAYQCRKSDAPAAALWLVACIAAAFAWFHPRALFFLPGIVAYHMHQSGRWSLRSAGLPGMAALLGFFASWQFLGTEDGRTLLRCVDTWPSALCTLAALLCGGFFFVQVLHDTGVLKRVLEWRCLVALGEVSYSFYLLHVIVIYPLKRLTARFVQPWLGDELSFLLLGLAALAVTYGLSLLSRRWLEVHAGEWAKANLARARERFTSAPVALR